MSPRALRLLAIFAPAVVAAGIIVACTPAIGDKCSISTDCSQLGDRLCDTTQPGGYCTVFNCEPDTCLNAICVAFNPTLSPSCGASTNGQYPRFEQTFCLAPCGSTGDCRDEYQCVDLSVQANQAQRQAEVVDLGAADGGLGFKVCMASTCADGIQDAAETDVDCGGPTCNACPDKKRCSSGTDCMSSTCVGGVCVDMSCTNDSNTMQSDKNCGGPECAPCAGGLKCQIGTDCASGICGTSTTSGICAPGDCFDQKQDGAETAVDCGGGGCVGCLVGQACNNGNDCATGVCTNNVCAPQPTPQVCLVPDSGPFSAEGGPTPYEPDAGWMGPDGG